MVPVTAPPASVTVVIATFERPEMCAAAVRSALNQVPAPVEVLVCDDGSTDETQLVFEAWAERQDRLQYLRLAENTGTPAAVRNLGVRLAKGDWLAFLDDDDLWLEGKLEAQLEAASERHALVATNAYRSGSRRLYFPELRKPVEVGLQIGCDNPIILSSALARTEAVRAVGGFREDRCLSGIEDYCLWLDLADRGALFLVLPDPLVRYRDNGDARLSASVLVSHRKLAAVALRRWRSTPTDGPRLRAATVHLWRFGKVVGRLTLDRLTALSQRGLPGRQARS